MKCEYYKSPGGTIWRIRYGYRPVVWGVIVSFNSGDGQGWHPVYSGNYATEKRMLSVLENERNAFLKNDKYELLPKKPKGF